MIKNKLDHTENIKNVTKIAKVGFWEFDAKNSIIEWNESIYELFEVANKDTQITYEYFLSFLPKDDKYRLIYEFSQSIKEKREYFITHKIITANNNIKYVEERAKHFYDEDGNHIRSIGSIYDTTENHLIKEKYKNLLDFASDGIHVVNSSGKIIEYSQSFLDMLGYKKNELKKLKIYDIDSSLNKTQIDNLIKELMSTPKTFKTTHKKKDGVTITVQINAKKIEINNEKFIYASARDITEHSEIEKKLKQQKDDLELEKTRLDTIIQNIPDLLWIKDTQGKFIRCNKRFEEFIGTKEKDIFGKTDYDFVDKKTADSFTKNDKKAMNSDKALINFEEVTYANDGHKEFLSTSKVKISDNNGKVLGILGIGRDITELRNSQIEIEKERQKYKSLIDQSSDAIIIVDLNGYVLESNKLFKSILGYEEEEISTLHISDFESIHSKEQINANIKKTAFEPLYFETIYRKKDGTFFDVSLSVKRVEIDGKHFLYSSFRDITEQKKLQHTLVKQKEEFETIFNYSHDALVIIDFNTRFLKFNKSFMALTEYSKEELLNLSCNDLTLPEDIEKNADAMKDAIENGHADNIEKTCISKNSKLVHVNMSVSLLPDKKRLLLSLKDISSLKIMEQQSRLASMGEMIGNIAHQWRQPLSMITTYASGLKLKSDLSSISKEDIDECEHNILKQANYLSNTIDNFRNFIKGEKLINRISIKNVVDNALSLLNASLKNNYINLVLDLVYDAKILGNKNELAEALINIINNSKDALKSTQIKEEDRFIFIETSHVDEDFIKLSIYDTAMGIEKRILDKIFEPYFTTKHQSQGTGLGLAMVDKIITDRHKGHISVYNKEFIHNGKNYKGACFDLIFTISREEKIED